MPSTKQIPPAVTALTAAFGLALAVVPQPAFAANVAISTGPTISVLGCEQVSMDVPIFPAGPSPAAKYENLGITFVNPGTAPVRRVRFSIASQLGAQLVDDVGTYSTGAVVHHNFQPATDENFSDPTRCVVTLLEFADGSVWQAQPSRR